MRTCALRGRATGAMLICRLSQRAFNQANGIEHSNAHDAMADVRHYCDGETGKKRQRLLIISLP